MRRALVAMVLGAVAGGCAPSPADGLLGCNPSGKACPDGYYCAANGTCWRDGHTPGDGGGGGGGGGGGDGGSGGTHKLSVSATGSGSGSVVVSGGSSGGTACANSCSYDEPAGAQVALTAVPTPTGDPSSGYAFTGWSGDCTGSGTCQLTMSSDKVATASFAFAYPLEVHFMNDCSNTSSKAPGWVTANVGGLDVSNCWDCGDDSVVCKTTIAQGATVSLTGQAGIPSGHGCTLGGGAPTTGSMTFTGDCVQSCGYKAEGMTCTCTFTMDRRKVVTFHLCMQSG